MQFASIKPGIGVLGDPLCGELSGELVVAAASRGGGSGIAGGIEDDLSVVRDFLVTLKGGNRHAPPEKVGREGRATRQQRQPAIACGEPTSVLQESKYPRLAP